MKQVEIFTDGSCLGNPGPGGIGILLRYQGHEKTLSQGYFQTTNKSNGTSGGHIALQRLKEPCQVQLHSDSQYMKNGITQWIFSWKQKGWKTAMVRQSKPRFMATA